MNAPGPIRLELGFANAYLFRTEDGSVLVDSGMASSRGRLDAALRAAGCEPGRPILHILTHPDFDHAGNSAWLREIWGAPVAIHADDAAALESGRMPPRHALGRPKWLLALSQALPRARGPACKADIILAEGQDLSPWGLQARIIHLPGHTAGSVGILVESGDGIVRDCVAGDLVSNWRKPGPGLLSWNLELYRSSLARLRSLLAPETIVWPGHGAPFEARRLADIVL